MRRRARITHVLFLLSKLVGGLYLHREKNCGEPNTKRIMLDYKSEWEEGRPWLYFDNTQDEMFCKVVRNGIENLGVESKFGTKCLAFAFVQIPF